MSKNVIFGYFSIFTPVPILLTPKANILALIGHIFVKTIHHCTFTVNLTISTFIHNDLWRHKIGKNRFYLILRCFYPRLQGFILHISTLFKSSWPVLSYSIKFYYFILIERIKCPFKHVNSQNIRFFAFFSIFRSFPFNLHPDRVDFAFFCFISSKYTTLLTFTQNIKIST